jgi:hypothetical protein
MGMRHDLPPADDILVILVTTLFMVGAFMRAVYSYFGSQEPSPSAIVYPIHAGR